MSIGRELDALAASSKLDVTALNFSAVFRLAGSCRGSSLFMGVSIFCESLRSFCGRFSRAFCYLFRVRFISCNWFHLPFFQPIIRILFASTDALAVFQVSISLSWIGHGKCGFTLEMRRENYCVYRLRCSVLVPAQCILVRCGGTQTVSNCASFEYSGQSPVRAGCHFTRLFGVCLVCLLSSSTRYSICWRTSSGQFCQRLFIHFRNKTCRSTYYPQSLFFILW